MERVARLSSHTREQLARHLDRHKGEDACFFLFRQLATADREIILIRKVVPIPEEHIMRRSEHEILFEGAALVAAFRQARLDRSFLGFIHSHPKKAVSFSKKDDVVDRSILHTIGNRIPEQPFFPSLIWTSGEIANGRVWTPQGVSRRINSVTVVGEFITFSSLPLKSGPTSSDEIFSRQIDVISSALQTALGTLRVGVVGLGGTGSATVAQLTRLGVGELVLIDPDKIERSNVNRVHGSSLSDVGLAKTAVSESFVRDIGIGTYVRSICGNVADQLVAEIVGTCDVVFGCTDDELGRSILSRLAYACLTPVFDMAIKITSRGRSISSIDGRVTTLLLGEACLECRERITGEGIRADSLRKHAPQQAEALERDGYIANAEVAAPAVVTFTTSIASHAINEFLHRLMGLYGVSRKSSEILVRFLEGQVRTNRKAKRDGCYCSTEDFHASGSKGPFLGLMWQS